MLATFLAFGVLMNFLRLGFLRYWQRQGFCSLILLQHCFDGGEDDVIAPTQELSSVGLHVTATVTCASTRRTIIRLQIATYDVFIFNTFQTQKDFFEREREREMVRCCAASGFASLPIYRRDERCEVKNDYTMRIFF